jgi:hypothetical protein
MEIDPALVVCIGIFKIVGEARYGREFIPGLWIEIGLSQPADFLGVHWVYDKPFLHNTASWPLKRASRSGVLRCSIKEMCRIRTSDAPALGFSRASPPIQAAASINLGSLMRS